MDFFEVFYERKIYISCSWQQLAAPNVKCFVPGVFSGSRRKRLYESYGSCTSHTTVTPANRNCSVVKFLKHGFYLKQNATESQLQPL